MKDRTLNSSAFLTAACLFGVSHTGTSFAPAARRDLSRAMPGRKPRIGIVFNNEHSNGAEIKIINEDSDTPILTGVKRLKAENIVTEKMMIGDEIHIPSLTEDNNVVEAITTDLLGSQELEAITTDFLDNHEEDLIRPSVEIKETERSGTNSDVPFTSDILSGIDQAKLMDPTEVLKSVIGPVFSDNVDSSSADSDAIHIITNTVNSVSITESSSQPLLEIIPETSISDSLQISESLYLEKTKSLAEDTDSSSTEPPVDIPSVRKILRFAIPAIGVWLCSPLLSLIDTSAVGLLSGTTQQAALNPAVAITDYSALLAAFMYTATTNLIAAAKEKDSQVEGKPLSTNTLTTSLQLSGLVGTVLGGVLILLTRVLLRSIIGNDAIDPNIFNAATKYVRIRALGMPAAVIIGSAQSACLGLQDIRSPLYVLLAAAVVNFFGDCIFVGSSNPIFGGAAGAAWATVFSQYAALGMFIKWLTTKPKKPKGETVDLTNAILELTSKSKKGKPRRQRFREALRSFKDDSEHMKITKAFKPISKMLKKSRSKSTDSSRSEDQNETTRGFLVNKFSAFDLLKLPSLDRAKQFWPYVIPVTTTSVGRVSSYVAMSYVVSSALGTVGMAAQQIIVSLFYCLTPVADSLNLTAQSFIPVMFEKKKSAARATALKKSLSNFMKSAGIFGSIMTAAAFSIPLFTGFFTTDPIVISQVNAVVPYLAGCFMVHGVITAGEGFLLGQKDLGFLGKAYASFFVGVPYFMLRVKQAAQSGLKQASLTSVWQVFLAYQFVRMGLFTTRLLHLQRRTQREVVYADNAEQ